MNVNEVVEQLKIAREFYYNGTPFLTDIQFDELENKLKELDPNNNYFNSVGTPTTRGVKKKHLVNMGSLNQIDENKQIINFQSGLRADEFIITDKLDGNSIAIYYDDVGNFSHAITRGDGIEGLDITRHVKKMSNKPPMKFEPRAVVRCEAIIKKQDFINHVVGYKNPRNYVAGQLNRTIADQTFLDYVHLVAFDYDRDLNKEDYLDILKQRGFDVVYWTKWDHDIKQITYEMLQEHLESRKLNNLYEIDGLVVEYNDKGKRNKLGFTHLNPNYAFKFKINQNYVDTTVVDVHWQPSKDGYLKPRVEIDPVDLAGVTISFATGFNAKFIKDNKIGKGSVVRITRSGDVIPKIEQVIESTESFSLPSFDQYGEYHWTDSGVDIVLDDKPELSNILETTEFFDKVGAPLLKRGNITKLYEAGFSDIESIIKMTCDELILVLGENGIKVFNGLRDCLTNIDEYILAGALPFFGRGTGRLKMQKIANHIGNISDIDYTEIMKIPGFDIKTANIISGGVEKYKTFLYNTKDYISIKYFTKTHGVLSGKSFCFTGIRVKELENEIIRKGGTITNSITSQTTYLVAKETTGNSNKLQKAREKGVIILTLDEAESIIYNTN